MWQRDVRGLRKFKEAMIQTRGRAGAELGGWSLRVIREGFLREVTLKQSLQEGLGGGAGVIQAEQERSLS